MTERRSTYRLLFGRDTAMWTPREIADGIAHGQPVPVEMANLLWCAWIDEPCEEHDSDFRACIAANVDPDDIIERIEAALR